MKKFMLFILALAFVANAQLNNWKGYLDTSLLWVNGTATTKYSKVYDLTTAENFSLTTMANDTDAAGLSIDTVRVVYGFQIGNPVINNSGSMDTAWGVYDTIDNIASNAYAATEGGGRSTNADAISETWGIADTSNVTGYATQIRPIKPYWGTYLRLWYRGYTGNSGGGLKIIAALYRRVGQITVSK